MSFLANLGFDDVPSKSRQVIHIRTQQRTGKKVLTIIEGLPTDLDLQKIAKEMRILFKVSGSVISKKEEEKKGCTKEECDYIREDWLLRNSPTDIIQLTGDQRETAKKFLLSFGICDKDDIIQTHGA
jgi:translation initiation factor 1